jgi:hypothetical protein
MTVYDHIFDHLPARNTAYTLYIYMVLANRIYTPFMTVYDHIFDHFPAEILLIHRIYKVLANPIHGPRFVLRPCMPSEQLITAMLCRISAMLYCLTTAMLCRFSGSWDYSVRIWSRSDQAAGDASPNKIRAWLCCSVLTYNDW